MSGEILEMVPESKTFWENLARGTLSVPWCSSCDASVWPPRSRCPLDYSPVTRWRQLSGLGTVYSFAVVHKGQPGFEVAAPYVVAYIDCDDGPRLLANVVDAGQDLHVGDRVALSPVSGTRAVFERLRGQA